MTLFFTSDLHFGHKNIIEYCNRPFRDVEHMNEMLIKNWNDTVGIGDEVCIVGDACMGQRDKTVPLLARLNGNKVLVPGNHDGCHPMYDKEGPNHKYAGQVELFDQYIAVGPPELKLTIDGKLAWFEDDVAFRICHFPYKVNGKSDYQGRNFGEWEPTDDDTPLLCGHVHDAWKTQITPNGTPMINVGTDNWEFKPVAFEVLVNLAKSLKED